MADNEHSLATYVSDMLALERHVREPFDTQRKDGDFSNDATASAIVTRLSALAQTHVDALDACLKRLGGHEASPIKSAVTVLEGAVAGAIDKMRKTKVSKALRDDYTALALCTAAYTMLQTTALGMRDISVADLAQRHLSEYAQAVMEIGEALPGIVIRELRDLDLDVDMAAAEAGREAASQAWRGSARSVTSSVSGEASYAGGVTLPPETPSRGEMGLR